MALVSLILLNAIAISQFQFFFGKWYSYYNYQCSPWPSPQTIASEGKLSFCVMARRCGLRLSFVVQIER
jgi:hypothetical protein